MIFILICSGGKSGNSELTPFGLDFGLPETVSDWWTPGLSCVLSTFTLEALGLINASQTKFFEHAITGQVIIWCGKTRWFLTYTAGFFSRETDGPWVLCNLPSLKLTSSSFPWKICILLPHFGVSNLIFRPFSGRVLYNLKTIQQVCSYEVFRDLGRFCRFAGWSDRHETTF